MYNFDILVNRKRTNSIKWDLPEKQFNNPDMVPLGIADMDFEAPPELKTALAARCADGTFGYTFEGDGYYDSIISWFLRRHALTLEREDIVSAPGVLEALSLIISAHTKKGDAILINPPVYHLFFKLIENLGRSLVTSPLQKKGGRYGLDFEDIDRKFKGNVRMVLLCSPHNPVGRVWEKSELAALADLCLKYGVLLVADEIHCDLVFRGFTHTTLLNAHPRAREFALVATAPSKTFNLAGLKTAMIFAPHPKLREPIKREIEKYHTHVNLIGLAATEIVYRHGDRWVDELLEYLDANVVFARNYIGTHLPSVRLYPPQGTYLIWLDFSSYGLEQGELIRILNKEAQVVVGNGQMCGQGGEGFIRVNIGTPRHMLEQGLNSICRAFSRFEETNRCTG
jgi:cystathionine beta-lyase